MTTTEERLRDAFAAAAVAVRVPVRDRAAVTGRARRWRWLVAGLLAALLGSTGAAVVVVSGPQPTGPSRYVVSGRPDSPGVVLVDARTGRAIRTLLDERQALGIRRFDLSPDGRTLLFEVSAANPAKGGCLPLRTLDVETGEVSELTGSAGAWAAQFSGREPAYDRIACEPFGPVIGQRRLNVRPGAGLERGTGRPVLARTLNGIAQLLYPRLDGSFRWHVAVHRRGCRGTVATITPRGALVVTECFPETFLELVPSDPAKPLTRLARLPERVDHLDADRSGRHVLMVGQEGRLLRWDGHGEPRYLVSAGYLAVW